MLPCTSRLWVLFTFLPVSSAGFFCHAEQAPPVRYHFGDDARWSDPSVDDGAWPIAEHGRWPVPPMGSDGFVWSRVRRDAGGPLAILMSDSWSDRLSGLSDILSYEIFVNGQLIVRRGSFPSSAGPIVSRGSRLCTPAAVASPGTA